METWLDLDGHNFVLWLLTVKWSMLPRGTLLPRATTAYRAKHIQMRQIRPRPPHQLIQCNIGHVHRIDVFVDVCGIDGRMGPPWCMPSSFNKHKLYHPLNLAIFLFHNPIVEQQKWSWLECGGKPKSCSKSRVNFMFRKRLLLFWESRKIFAKRCHVNKDNCPCFAWLIPTSSRTIFTKFLSVNSYLSTSMATFFKSDTKNGTFFEKWH